jgi:phosphatidylglycerol:prolipoprotein diacylglycerol transferase
MITDPTIARITHYALEWAGLATGLALYRSFRKKRNAPGLTDAGSFPVVVACLLGAAIGNKLSFWIDNPHLWNNHTPGMGAWLAGQSIVGALLGGWLGIEIGKRIAGLHVRTGDDYVQPVLAGLVVGRIGCFLAGLHDGTCGLPTQLPWGIDFGDGVARHPTQLYELFLALTALVTYPYWRKYFASTPGLAFRIMMLGYLAWRVHIDMLKPVPYAYALGLSGIQWICLLSCGMIITGLASDLWRKTHELTVH